MHWRKIQKMTNTEKTCEFYAAVRGYHFYQNNWSPLESEFLECHEFGNVFDMFAIKICKSNGQTVGHLPREISRVTNFCWREVQWCTLITTDYRRSPLVQGGLEIACKVTVKMVATVKNHMLIERYLQLDNVECRTQE